MIFGSYRLVSINDEYVQPVISREIPDYVCNLDVICHEIISL